MPRFIAWIVVVWLVAMTVEARGQVCTISFSSVNFGSVNVLPGTSISSSGSTTISCTGTPNNVVTGCLEMSVGINHVTGSGGTQRYEGLYGGNSSSPKMPLELYIAGTVWGSWGLIGAPYGSGGYQWNLTLNAGGSGTLVIPYTATIFAGQQTTPPGPYDWWNSGLGTTYAYSTGQLCPSIVTASAKIFDASHYFEAIIAARCLIAATNMDFGTVSALNTGKTATSTLSVQCTNTTPYSVALNGGNAAAVDPTQRKMTRLAETITYGLYKDAAHTSAFGSSVGQTVAGTGTGFSQNTTIYGYVPAQSTPSPGIYSDTIVATVTY